MTIPVARLLMKTAPPGLSMPARSVLHHLGLKARPSGTLRWPVGDRQLVADTGYSLSSVRRGRRELVRAGALAVLATGSGPERSQYAFPQMLAPAAVQEVAVGQTGPSSGSHRDHPLCSDGPRGVVRVNTPTRARTQSFQGSSSLTQEGKGPRQDDAAPLRGSEEHMASASGAAATPACPTAAKRGKPCASCRACGTNPRAARARVAAERERGQRVVSARHDPAQVARNQEGLAQARAALAARAKAKAADDDQGAAVAAVSGPSTAGGAL